MAKKMIPDMNDIAAHGLVKMLFTNDPLTKEEKFEVYKDYIETIKKKPRKVKGCGYCLGGIMHRKPVTMWLDPNATHFRTVELSKLPKFDSCITKEIKPREFLYRKTNKVDKFGRPIYVWTESKKYKNY